MQEPTRISSVTLTSVLAIVLAVALLAMGSYAWREHGSAQRLATENQQIASALKTNQAQLDSLAAKVNALSEPIAERSSKLPAAHTRKASAATSRRRRADDPRWKQFQAQLDSTRKDLDANKQDIEATRRDLEGAKSDLGGSIARTHGELVVLQKKGERSFYEFDIDKSKQFHNTGPVGIRLRKTSDKHQYADLELMVDDADLSKKHVDLYEPVVFYAAEGGRPVELVINSIRKNHIHGYVSEPKYKSSDLVAAGNAPTGAGASNAAESPTTPPRPRQKLEVPKN